MKFNNKNIEIGKNVTLGKNVKIGDNTVIYDNVIIGDNTIICNDCIIGEPENDYYFNENYENPNLIIGANSLVRSHSIIYGGSEFGDGLQTGHRVTIREKTQVGINCLIGSYSDIQGDCKIGNYVRLHSYVNIGQKTIIDDYVFFYPFTIATNDPTPPSNKLVGVMVGKFSQITTGAILLPGAKLGENCVVGANSNVVGEFEDNSFISGTPAKRICDIRKAPFFNVETGKRHYPWQKNFSRNMPWDKLGYDAWILKQNDFDND